MEAINTATTNINRLPSLQDIEQTSSSKTVGVNIDDILPFLGKDVGKTLSDIVRGPGLKTPSTSLSKDASNDLKAYLLEKQDNPEFIRSFGVLHEKIESGVNKLIESKVKEQSEQGKPLDISGLSSSAVALIVAASVLMLTLNTADSKLSSTLSLVSFDAAKTTASSIQREGMNSLASSISQSTLQLGITAVGAKKEHKGISNERGALKNNSAKLEALNAERVSIQSTLNTHNATKLGANADGLSKLETQSTKGKISQNLNEAAPHSGVDNMVGDSVTLQTSNQRLSPEHHAALARRRDDIDIEMASQQNALDDNKLQARAEQTTGDAIMKSSQAVGGIAGASGQYAATLERSEQQISQLNSRVATTASEDARESSQKTRSLIQELLRMMDSISQSKNATTGAVAGNIRA